MYKMGVIKTLIDFIIHIDKYLDIIIQNFGVLTYAFLFIIVFLETGLVITPFLPGDSLIFVAGAFAARGSFNIFLLWIILSCAAVLGDSVNYWIGKFFGEKVFLKIKLIKKEHLDKTKTFFDRHGGKTIILARFVPIVRTFAPFVAGIGEMEYKKFFSFNVIGGLAWVTLFLFAGYFFGRLEFVEKNLTLVIFAIIGISLVPPIYEVIKEKMKSKKK